MSLGILDGDADGLGRILAGLPQFVIVVDRAGIIRYVNRVQPGYERSKVLGMPASALDFGDSRAVFESAFRRVLETGEPGEYEVSILAPDGTRTWFRSEIYPYRAGDAVAGALIVAIDVTELKLAQKAVSDLRQLLPICAWCGQIRNDRGTWEPVEQYLRTTMQTSVTHGVCPDCQRQQMDELDRVPGADRRT